jgi:hypothetical protein
VAIRCSINKTIKRVTCYTIAHKEVAFQRDLKNGLTLGARSRRLNEVIVILLRTRATQVSPFKTRPKGKAPGILALRSHYLKGIDHYCIVTPCAKMAGAL